MEVYGFFRFLSILKESIKLLPKNGKVMATIVTFSLVLYSIAFLLLGFSLKSLIIDMFVVLKSLLMSDPSSYDDPDQSMFTQDPLSQILGQADRLKEDIALLLAVQMAFSIAVFILSILLTTATVLTSALSCKDKTISIKELCSRIDTTTWKRVLITGFYTKIHSTGYWGFVLALVSPLLISANQATILAAILLGILAFLYYLYLGVIWSLAIVVSVLEECCYGMEALGKAAAIVKGKKFHGIMVYTCYNLFCVILFLGYMIQGGKKGTMDSTIYGELFVFLVSTLGKILLDVAYTVFYFHCKKSHVEEIEVYGSVEYAKLPATIQPVDV